jgi:general secretion pathway protein A
VTDLLSYWHLRERPFEATWDTRFYFHSQEHDEALNRLLFLAGEQSMNMGLLTGEIGCGKTLTRAVFSERLDPARFVVVTQENSAFAFKDLLALVLRNLGRDSSGKSKLDRCEELRDIAEKIKSEGRHLVLIFDEAQEMSKPTLNELKLLTNLNGGGQNYLTIILLGQPELRALVAQLPAIDQRISLRYHLKPLTADEALSYIQHRLRAAGHPDGELFEAAAAHRACEVARGIPRELNRIAKLALEFAWVRELPQVTEAAVETIVRDLARHQNLAIAA